MRQAPTTSPRSSPAVITRAVPAAAAKVSPAAAVSRANVTITQKQTSPAKPAPSKNVIDVVDLSDEDDPDDPKPVTQKTPVKTTPTQLAQARARQMGVARPGGTASLPVRISQGGSVKKTVPTPVRRTHETGAGGHGEHLHLDGKVGHLVEPQS